MSKKKAAKKPAKPNKPSRRAAGSPRAKKAPRTQSVRAARLKGLEDMPKYTELDRTCANLRAIRDRRAEDSSEEKANLQNALRQLKNRETTQYVAHGIRVIRVAGEEKVLCSKVKDDNGGEADLGPAPEETGGGDGGATQTGDSSL